MYFTYSRLSNEGIASKTIDIAIHCLTAAKFEIYSPSENSITVLKAKLFEYLLTKTTIVETENAATHRRKRLALSDIPYLNIL